MRDDQLPDLSRAFAQGRMSRRSMLRLLGGISVTAAAAASGVTLAGVARAQGDSCQGRRRPLTSPTDCPDNRVPKQDYTPLINGCGPQSGTDYVPDDWGAFSFHEPCNGHDRCYGTCGSDKVACDEAFRDDLLAECARLPWYLATVRIECTRNAYAYFAAVRFSGAGQDAYGAGQMEGCDCCESEAEDSCVQCSCTGEIYTDSNRCIDECRSSLGCHTGLCHPVECPK